MAIEPARPRFVQQALSATSFLITLVLLCLGIYSLIDPEKTAHWLGIGDPEAVAAAAGEVKRVCSIYFTFSLLSIIALLLHKPAALLLVAMVFLLSQGWMVTAIGEYDLDAASILLTWNSILVLLWAGQGLLLMQTEDNSAPAT